MHIGFQVEGRQLDGLNPHRVTGLLTLVFLLGTAGLFQALRPRWNRWQDGLERRVLPGAADAGETPGASAPVSAEDLLD